MIKFKELGHIADAEGDTEDAGEYYFQAFQSYEKYFQSNDARLIELGKLYAEWLRSEERSVEAEAIEKRFNQP